MEGKESWKSIIIAGVIVVAFWITIMYVSVHFIVKYW